MDHPLLIPGAVAAVALIAFGFAIVLKRRFGEAPQPRESEDEWPFRLKQSVLTQREQELLWRLHAVLPDHLVLAQGPGLLEVRSGVANFVSWHNRISQKSFDFVVCTKDAAPVLAIELDDRSHGRGKRVAADATKDRAAEAAGLQLDRWNAAELPDVETICVAVTPVEAVPGCGAR